MANIARYAYQESYKADLVQFWLNPDSPVGESKVGNWKYYERNYNVQYLYCEEFSYDTPLEIATALLKGLIKDNKPHNEERMLVEYLMKHDAADKIALYEKESKIQQEEVAYHTKRLIEAVERQFAHSRCVAEQWKMSADEKHALLVQASDYRLTYGRAWYWEDSKNEDYAERVAVQRKIAEADLWDTFDAWFVLNYPGSVK